VLGYVRERVFAHYFGNGAAADAFRAALMPQGQPQERVLTASSFLARYGPDLLDAIAAEVARWAATP